ncbi:hypothetical protein KSF78_0008864 [Schistosoma japonicum]|nr:hypothetical protein KSF78_0008864 [Schistosoma japonicum]KAH8858286.1 hypothetical protein KSF78_0008864 [Schistosoma japonicum]
MVMTIKTLYTLLQPQILLTQLLLQMFLKLPIILIPMMLVINLIIGKCLRLPKIFHIHFHGFLFKKLKRLPQICRYPHPHRHILLLSVEQDRIKRGKINRSVVIPATCYSMDSSAFLKLENTIHNNNINISALDSISDNEEYHFITSEAIANRHKPSTDSEMSTVDNCTSYTANATPFICQASLFNLNTNSTGVASDSRNINSNSNIGNMDEKTAETRHTEAPAILLGNQIVATDILQYDLSNNKIACQENNNVNMNDLSQSQHNLQNKCHVLSCATLFNDDEENLSNNNSDGDDNKVFTMKTEGDRVKYLRRIYSKWSVFPVYIGNENITCDDGSIDKEDENSEECSSSRKLSNPTVSHHAKGPLHSIINPIRSLVRKMKNSLDYLSYEEKTNK